jgi:hypothetical protein
MKDNTKADSKEVELDSLDLTGLVWALLYTMYCWIVMHYEAELIVTFK